MRAKSILSAGLLFILLVACQEGEISMPPRATLPATATTLPTATVTPSPVATPTPTPTPTPVPVWRISFSGAPCSEMPPDCQPFDDTPTYYYAINSDGTGLERVRALPSITIILPPEGSPPPFINRPPQISPDGSHLAYASGDGLYITNTESGGTHHIFRSDNISGASPVLGPLCWTPDGSLVRFVVRSRESTTWVNIFYATDRNGENLQTLFAIAGIGVDAGDCSPDNLELAFSSGFHDLYIVRFDTGKWRKILADYFVGSIRAWPVESGP